MMTRWLVWVLAVAVGFGWVGAAVANDTFVPLGTGSFGEINALDGDRAFNASYYNAATATGEALTTRLESYVGAELPPESITSSHYAVRWTGTLTPNRSGVFPVRVGEGLTVTIDGRVLTVSTGARFMTVPLERGRPYDIVVEGKALTRGQPIAVEWGDPVQNVVEVSPVRVTAEEKRFGPSGTRSVGPRLELENRDYRLESRSDGSLLVIEKGSGARAEFAPDFWVVFEPSGQETAMDSKGGKYSDDGIVGHTNYVVPSWAKETDYFKVVCDRVRLSAVKVQSKDNGLQWLFPTLAHATLEAEVSLAESGEPKVTFRLTPKADGQFSVGYAGAPAQSAEQADWIWQPLVWQDKRFPDRSYLTKEFQCPIPFVMAGMKGVAVGVGADVTEMPYRMPTIADSRFGVLVRNAAGEAQPIVFAPILGGPESRRRRGQEYTFQLRLLVRKGAWFDSYQHLARTQYGVHDERENVAVNLNTTIENMTDYVLTDEFSYWYPRYKTWGYQNDGGPGTGRQQSSADAISLAMVFDRTELLEKRARPTLEYMLSRRSNTTKFADPGFMGGFVNYPTDLVAAYRLTGGRTTAIREKLEPALGRQMPSASPVLRMRDGMEANLVWHRLTEEKSYLRRARDAADRYIALRIAVPAVNFADVRSSFWTELAPAYDVLYELYAETGEERYLEASAAAMRQFSAYTYLVPVAPRGNFTANPGGVYNRQPVPEEIVPAWQVSANGLAAECAGTAHSHRGVFMTSYASYMLRLGAKAGEPLFTDIGRNAVVGRYANYPSYAYRNGYTTVHQKADYPLRSFEEIKKFTSAHYNHPLPMTAFLVDYLVADVAACSRGEIDFESDFTNSGAYFRNRVYGARPGHFYGERNVFLWLPKGLVRSDSIQLNYVAGRGNGKLYLAFMNQADRPIQATVRVDRTRVRLPELTQAEVWCEGVKGEAIEVRGGKAAIAVAAKGITAIAIAGAQVSTEIQDAMLDATSPALPAGSSVTVKSPFDDVTATALRFGRGLTSVHVWLKAGTPLVQRATLRYRSGSQTVELVNEDYPFEFTIPVSDDATEFRAVVEAVTPAGVRQAPELVIPLRSAGQR